MAQPLGREDQALGVGVAEPGLAPEQHGQRRVVVAAGDVGQLGVELADRLADPGAQPVGQADRLDDRRPIGGDAGLGDSIRQLIEHTY
jgi:hypothetical protein